MSLNHVPSKSFATAVTGSEWLNFKTRFGVTWHDNQISSYDEESLVNPFVVIAGSIKTVFTYCFDSAMWLHHLIYSVAFIGIIAIDVYWYPADQAMTLPGHVKEVIGKFQTLAAFLFGFYVNQHINRWWRLRTAGVQAVQGANCDIASQLGIVYADIHHQCHEQAVLDTVLAHISNIRRYAATSLYWLFMEGGQTGFDRDNLTDFGFLTPDELEILKNLPRGTQPEYLWSVIGTESAKIFEEMLEIETFDTYYRVLAIEELNHSWLHGRAGVGLIKEQLTCPIPYDYANAVSMLVMVNNIALFLVYAIASGKDWHAGDLGTQCAYASADFIALHLLALVYNVLTTLSARSNNPFDDGRVSFPGWRYIHKMLEDFEVMANIKHEQQGDSAKPAKRASGGGRPSLASRPFAASSSLQNSELKFRASRASMSAKSKR